MLCIADVHEMQEANCDGSVVCRF